MDARIEPGPGRPSLLDVACDLEQSRVRIALLSGQPAAAALEAGAQMAQELEATDRLAAVRLFANLGRWQAPALLERAVQSLARKLEARESASEALLIDPGIVTREGPTKSWPSKYELQHYHWHADDVTLSPDPRYSLDACRGGSAPPGARGSCRATNWLARRGSRVAQVLLRCSC